MQLTVNYMSSQKNDMFMQRYGFSSPVVISSQLVSLPERTIFNFILFYEITTIEQCFRVASYFEYMVVRNRS